MNQTDTPSKLDIAKGVVEKTLTVVCVVLFMLLVVVVSWQVFSRQILGSPSQWSETLSRYLFVWVGLFGAALVFGERGHMAIDVAVRLLPKAPQKIIGIFVQVIVIAFSAYILVWGGWRASMNAWSQNLAGLPTAVGPWYLVLPISGGLIILFALYSMIKIMTGEEEPFEGEDQEVVEAVESYADGEAAQDAISQMRTEPGLDGSEVVEDSADDADDSAGKDK